jgi:hypothetical protein
MAIWLTIGALVAIVGAWSQFRKKRGQAAVRSRLTPELVHGPVEIFRGERHVLESAP